MIMHATIPVCMPRVGFSGTPSEACANKVRPIKNGPIKSSRLLPTRSLYSCGCQH